MGNSEETKPSKPVKPSSPPLDQANNIHVYPDWAAMQAFYGARVAVPPYFNSAVASGHAPHPYMWGPPQHMMPPYGPPYAAIYAHGGVYAHPGVTLAAIPNMETPTKSSGNTDQGLVKKLKEFDGLAMSLGNGNADSAEGGADSQSEETEGSSDRSNGNTGGVGQNGRKRSREEIPSIGEDGKTKTQSSPVPVGEINGALDKVMGVIVPPPSVAGNMVGTITALELGNSPNANASPNGALLQNDRELKRERRKQSNRESARRSRLRKQAEAEELATRVESLVTENMSLKSEINQLTENSKKLKLETAMLMEKLKNAQGGRTENLLSRVNNSGSVERSDERSEMYESNSKTGAKLRQLLDTSPRADAVAAG
ncbi:Common plant regulatory factor 1 [Camellia lanceoleosa]|uniref:Common plant regulatory factor 1 n=1 Tax=Camellia lanceoleosa TaxID=1840588 RepID=A0ACC0IFP1_9ERIC|nr:Common plant regulatory factor 1 [Camellia lanceoleosa]